MSHSRSAQIVRHSLHQSSRSSSRPLVSVKLVRPAARWRGSRGRKLRARAIGNLDGLKSPARKWNEYFSTSMSRPLVIVAARSQAAGGRKTFALTMVDTKFCLFVCARETWKAAPTNSAKVVGPQSLVAPMRWNRSGTGPMRSPTNDSEDLARRQSGSLCRL